MEDVEKNELYKQKKYQRAGHGCKGQEKPSMEPPLGKSQGIVVRKRLVIIGTGTIGDSKGEENTFPKL